MIDNISIEENEIMKYVFPMSEIITDFFDIIKSLTRGYGSLEYEFIGYYIININNRYRAADVKKLVIHIMDEPVDSLSFMVRSERAFEIGKSICKKLKEKIDPELFVVSI